MRAVAAALVLAAPHMWPAAAQSSPPAPSPGPIQADPNHGTNNLCADPGNPGCYWPTAIGPGVQATTGRDEGCIGRVQDGPQGGPSDFVGLCPDPATGELVQSPPPTHDEVVRDVCPPIAGPLIGRNPPGEGITGLDIYLWASPQGPAYATGSIRGWPVTCSVTPILWTFSSGDGAVYDSDTHGAAHPDQAATHVYETRGDYWLEVDVAWERASSAGRDSLARSAAEPYHLYEVRAVLIDSG